MTIVSPEVERLAKLLGAQTGKSAEQVIREAVEAQARIAGVELPDPGNSRKSVDLDRVREIIQPIASRPLQDTRSANEILDKAWGQA